MLVWWLLAGWKMKFGVGLWLALAVAGWRWRKIIVFRGGRAAISVVTVFCLLTLAVGWKLTTRILDYRRVVSNPVVDYAIGADVPRQIAETSAFVPGPKDWPWWRGPSFDNHSESEVAPVQWEPDDVTWKAAVPGRGHSSPILSGNSLYLTTADEEQQSQQLLAYDRDDGHLLWSKIIHQGIFALQHAKNSYASSTPACDDQYVYTVFLVDGTVYLTAVDFHGQIAWQQAVGEFESSFGYCASPVIYRSIVVVTVMGDTTRRIAAFDRRTGERRWQSDFRDASTNHASPALGTTHGAEILVIPGALAIQGFDPASGRLEWSLGWNVNSASNTATIADQKVFASGTVPDNVLICLQLDQTGAHELWQVKTGVPKVPSPLVVQNHLFVVTDNGIMECLETETGRQLGRRRLGGDFSSSPLYAAGRIYVASEEGRVFALSADAKLDLLATNDIGEPILATPVISDRQMFVRTAKSLICIGADPAPRRAESPDH